jgi:hypothetical protein
MRDSFRLKYTDVTPTVGIQIRRVAHLALSESNSESAKRSTDSRSYIRGEGSS